MIIAGNSNVSTFKQQGLIAAAGHESSSVVWVGGLKVEHFFNGHPAGEKVRDLFAHNFEWKFLSIGIHDIHDLCFSAAQGRLPERLSEITGLYFNLFKEFGAVGNFGWLVFPQAIHEVTFSGLTSEDILEITKEFNGQIEEWCRKERIIVINPLQGILGPDGLPRSHFLQRDGIHLNIEAAKLYLAEISRLCGLNLGFQKSSVEFEPQNEPESFCHLLLGTLNIPFDRGIGRAGLENTLVKFVKDLLHKKGLDVVVDAKTELVYSGLLDSLDLVEIYTYALNVIQIESDFSVNLRSLTTIGAICNFLTSKQDFLKQESAVICFSDFITSLRGNFENQDERPHILEADYRIATMDEEKVRAFVENLAIVAKDFICGYGIIYLWLAFWAAEKRNYAMAIQLLEHATNTQVAFPFTGGHQAYYLKRWSYLDRLADFNLL
jgi:hypothetical protein